MKKLVYKVHIALTLAIKFISRATSLITLMSRNESSVEIRETKDYYIDTNGNRFSKTIYSKKTALKMSKTLINCANCYNCENCTNCTNCRYCYNCYNCEKCNHCYDCKDCYYCVDCFECENYYYHN